MIKLTDILNEDCWKGYKQLGMKEKNGKQVPNCIPIDENKSSELQFPEGFQPAKIVPKGGAMCANCSKWDKKSQLCKGQYYIEWNGNGKIPTNPTEYVCIWWVNKSIKESNDKTITCKNCGWAWKLSEGGKDPYICHKCGYNNK